MAMSHLQSPLYSQLQPIALLILVENSSAVSNVWTDLRDQHLINLADNIKAEVERPVCRIYLNFSDFRPLTVSPDHSVGT